MNLPVASILLASLRLRSVMEVASLFTWDQEWKVE